MLIDFSNMVGFLMTQVSKCFSLGARYDPINIRCIELIDIGIFKKCLHNGTEIHLQVQQVSRQFIVPGS